MKKQGSLSDKDKVKDLTFQNAAYKNEIKGLTEFCSESISETNKKLAEKEQEKQKLEEENKALKSEIQKLFKEKSQEKVSFEAERNLLLKKDEKRRINENNKELESFQIEILALKEEVRLKNEELEKNRVFSKEIQEILKGQKKRI